MPLITAKILGLPTRRAWAQVYSFTPDEELLSSRGSLVAVASITTTLEPDPTQPLENEAVIQAGKSVLSGLHEEYFSKGEGTPFEKLKEATQKVATLVTEDIEKLETLNCVLWKQYIYFCALGGGEVWVFKNNHLSNLLKLKTPNHELFSISGKLTGGEVFLFGTSDFFASVDTLTLEKIFEKTQVPDQIADNLNPLVHRKNNPLAAAVVFQVQSSFSQSPKGEIKSPANFFKRKLVKFAQKLPESSLYVKKEERSRRTALSIGIVLLLILSVSIFFGLRQKSVNERKSSYESRLGEAQSLYSDALETYKVDREQARSKFSDAQGIVGALLREGVKDKALDELRSKMQQEEGAVLGRVEVAPSLFIDLSLVRSGITAREIALHEDKIAVLDTSGERFFLVSTKTKETRALGGSEKTTSPQGVSLYAGRIFTLTEKGIIEIDKQGVVKTVVERDDNWGSLAKIGAFGGNIYLLSREGAIWRHPRIETGFATKQAWLSKDATPDFSLVQDWAIDGSIWLLSSNGEISKFTHGAKDSFRVSGTEGGLSASTAIYTDKDLESIFVLDKDRARIVEIEKNGKHKLEYQSEELKTAYALVVSKELSKIFILQESKILETPLR